MINVLHSCVQAYKKGHAFRRAVELSRKKFPGYVVTLEEAWGDWLVSQKQIDQGVLPGFQLVSVRLPIAVICVVKHTSNRGGGRGSLFFGCHSPPPTHPTLSVSDVVGSETAMP